MGVIVYLVTHNDAYTNTDWLTDDQKEFMRLTVTGIPAAACIIGTLAVLFYPIPEYE